MHLSIIICTVLWLIYPIFCRRGDSGGGVFSHETGALIGMAVGRFQVRGMACMMMLKCLSAWIVGTV